MGRKAAERIVSRPGHYSVSDVMAACSFFADMAPASMDDHGWQQRADVVRWAHYVRAFQERFVA